MTVDEPVDPAFPRVLTDGVPGVALSICGSDAEWRVAGWDLIEQANKRAKLDDWYEGIIDGAGLAKTDPRLTFRRMMFAMARTQAGVVQRRRDTREHLALYLKAFNAWAGGEPITTLRFTAREPVPAITKIT